MIAIQIEALIASRKALWGRRITLTEVSSATGISRMTLHRMMRSEGYSTVTDHLDKLCAFFQCDISELLTYVPDQQPSDQPLATSGHPHANLAVAA